MSRVEYYLDSYEIERVDRRKEEVLAFFKPGSEEGTFSITINHTSVEMPMPTKVIDIGSGSTGTSQALRAFFSEVPKISLIDRDAQAHHAARVNGFNDFYQVDLEVLSDKQILETFRSGRSTEIFILLLRTSAVLAKKLLLLLFENGVHANVFLSIIDNTDQATLPHLVRTLKDLSGQGCRVHQEYISVGRAFNEISWIISL